MQSDPSAAVKGTTLDGHKLRVGLSNRTVNTYATTMAGVFKSATHRGRFTATNPFEDQKRKAGGESKRSAN